MNISEILDKLSLVLDDSAQRLCEWAYPIKDVRKRFIDLSENIIEHIVKIILYGEQYPTTVNHWCAELFANLTQCMKRQIKRKGQPYATATEISTWLLTGFDTADSMKGLRYSLSAQYENPKEITNDKLYEQIKQFILTVSEPLARLELTKQDIYAYFKEL